MICGLAIRLAFVFVIGFLLTFVCHLTDNQARLRLVAAQLVLDPALVHAVHLQGAVLHVQARVRLGRRDLHPLRLLQLVAVVEPRHLRLRISRVAGVELCACSLLDPVRLDLLRDLGVLNNSWKTEIEFCFNDF